MAVTSYYLIATLKDVRGTSLAQPIIAIQKIITMLDQAQLKAELVSYDSNFIIPRQWKCELFDLVKRPIESSTPVHVLSPSSCLLNVG